MNYDVIIIGARPGGIFVAYELMKRNRNVRLLYLKKAIRLKRKCPIDGDKIKSCINCKRCRSCADLEEPEHFRMENTISPMISAELYLSISVKNRLLS